MLVPTLSLTQAFVATAVLVVFYRNIALYLSRRKLKLEHQCQPPHSVMKLRDPILGSDRVRRYFGHHKAGAILQNIYNEFQAYGTTYTFNTMYLDMVMTIDPINLRHVLAVNFKDFGIGQRHLAFGKLLGHGIFTSDGERWHRSRGLIRPTFAHDHLANLDSMERHFQLLLRLIPGDGATVDLQELFYRFTIDTAAEFLIGESVGSLRAMTEGRGANSEFAETFSRSQTDCIKRLRLGFLSRLYFDKEADRCHAFAREFMEGFVDRAIADRNSGRFRDAEKAGGDEEEGRAARGRYVFLEEMTQHTTDREVLRDELMNVLMAGRDTTAGCLGSFWHELAQRPDIWAKLKAEIAQLEGKPPTYETLRNLKYLKYCLNEALRLWPAVPANARYALRDTWIPRGGGPDGNSPMFIRKGRAVGFSVFTMHRRKDLWGEDALEFNPDRWEHHRPGWEYLPFNGGPRICIGQQFALTEAAYVTTRLLQEFERVESRSPGPWAEHLTISLSSRNGAKVGLYTAASVAA